MPLTTDLVGLGLVPPISSACCCLMWILQSYMITSILEQGNKPASNDEAILESSCMFLNYKFRAHIQAVFEIQF